jgi:hypothetical protein
MHGNKNAIDAYESYPEMYPAYALAHMPAKHFGKPKVGGGKHAED